MLGIKECLGMHVCVECRFIALGSRNSRGKRELGKERKGEKERRLMYCAKLKHSIAASRRGEKDGKMAGIKRSGLGKES